MDIIDYWIFSAAVIAAYAVAVLVVLCVSSAYEDETEDKDTAAAKVAFRKWFRFAN